MFKRLGIAWNANTPEYLHPRTKANIIWQIKMTVLLLAGMWIWDGVKEYRRKKHLNIETHVTRYS